MEQYSIAVHGGASIIPRSNMTVKKEAEYKEGLIEAIFEGERILKGGGHSVDAVEAAIKTLENNPLFNAGKGAVFTNTGKNEMDAAIMNGGNLMAGAIAGIKNIKNPICLAKAVMDKSQHVFLTGSGAMEFAEKNNIAFEQDEYFFVQARYEQLQKAKESDVVALDHSGDNLEHSDKKFGTVGAVALDVRGNLAAGTSTGGMTNKKFGRVGDSPIIGAGTYANNNTCAISCTGHGELFIRHVVAYDVSCLMEYKGLSLKEACNIVIKDKLVKVGARGGLIALDTKGNIELPYNAEGMYRAMKKSDADIFVGIYDEQ